MGRISWWAILDVAKDCFGLLRIYGAFWLGPLWFMDRFGTDPIEMCMLQIVQNEVKGHEKNYRYVYETGQQLLDRGVAVDRGVTGSDSVDKLRSDFDSLHRWTDLVSAVDKRVDQCRSAIEQLTQYRVGSTLVFHKFIVSLLFCYTENAPDVVWPLGKNG